jgi:hypothetical protein
MRIFHKLLLLLLLLLYWHLKKYFMAYLFLPLAETGGGREEDILLTCLSVLAFPVIMSAKDHVACTENWQIIL